MLNMFVQKMRVVSQMEVVVKIKMIKMKFNDEKTGSSRSLPTVEGMSCNRSFLSAIKH